MLLHLSRLVAIIISFLSQSPGCKRYNYSSRKLLQFIRCTIKIWKQKLPLTVGNARYWWRGQLLCNQESFIHQVIIESGKVRVRMNELNIQEDICIDETRIIIMLLSSNLTPHGHGPKMSEGQERKVSTKLSKPLIRKKDINPTAKNYTYWYFAC